MSTSTVAETARVMQFVYSDPKAEACSERSVFFDEPIDFDWWEPTSEWRRENARWVEWFGGEQFGQASPPVEGPNNPNRLRRELDDAEADRERANGKMDEAIDEVRSATARIERLDRALEVVEREERESHESD